jgi:hypothetical protein
MKHTPGPWSDDWNFIVVSRADGRENYIAQICESDEEGLFIEDSAERAANARLIAAAPDLLAALRALLDWGREHTSPTDANSPHQLLIAASDAIAKAGV